MNAPNKALPKENIVKTDQTHSIPNFDTNAGNTLMTKNINSYPKTCTIPPITPRKNLKKVHDTEKITTLIIQQKLNKLKILPYSYKSNKVLSDKKKDRTPNFYQGFIIHITVHLFSVYFM